MNDDEFIPTRRSLLSRLRNWNDQVSWQEFFDTYARLIHRVAVKAGLSDAEGQDVVQEPIIIVARKLAGFKYDPALGSFKSWLLLITRRRIEKQLKKRMPARVGQASRLSGAGGTPARSRSGVECRVGEEPLERRAGAREGATQAKAISNVRSVCAERVAGEGCRPRARCDR